MRYLLVTLVLLLALHGPVAANAGVAGKAVGRAASKRAATSAAVKKEVTGRQQLGPIHTFKKPTVVERYTNRPATDKIGGLGGKGQHVFTRHPSVGRRGTAEHMQKELNIPHPVKQREVIKVSPGMKYHERPIRGGEAHKREVIIHGRVPGKGVKLGDKLSHATK